MAGGTTTITRFASGLLAIDLSAGVEFIRIHQTVHGPVFFGPRAGVQPQNRYDAPNGQYRMLYGAEELSGAFVEAVLRRPGRILRRAFVEERAWSILRVRRPLKLAKLYDEGLQWHGVHAGTIGVDEYTPSRQLALDFYVEFPSLDGLAYRSRYNNGQICFALFDRVPINQVDVVQTTEFSADQITVDRLMEFYGAAFDTSSPP